MTTIRINVSGTADIAGKYDAIGTGGWKPGLLALVGGLVQRQTVNRIRSTKTDPDGAPWAAWAAATARRKRKGSGLMVVTGRLMGSIEASVAGDTAVIGTNVFYGAFHQEGTSKTPQRRIFGLAGKDEDEVRAAASAFVRRRLGL